MHLSHIGKLLMKLLLLLLQSMREGLHLGRQHMCRQLLSDRLHLGGQYMCRQYMCRQLLSNRLQMMLVQQNTLVLLVLLVLGRAQRVGDGAIGHLQRMEENSMEDDHVWMNVIY